MNETAKLEGHLSSAAAFVEGGTQDACEDACSICLEPFCDSEPSTVTGCKHEFHLQCILEWCQRSSQCPMCWQPITLKDSTSQELFEAVENERDMRIQHTRNSAIFYHPALGDFELQHLPIGATENEIEERIIQHLAAAASMDAAHQMARREGQRVRSAAHARPQFLAVSTNPNAPAISSVSSSPQRVEDVPAAGAALAPFSGDEVSSRTSLPVHQITDSSGTSNANRPPLYNNRASAGQSTPIGQDRAGPSDFQTFSESLKSRLNNVSTRYKETITKSTRGWKERLFSRNSSMADIGSEVKREVSAGIASVSRMMERFDAREPRRSADTFNAQSSSRISEVHKAALKSGSSAPTSNAAGSGSN